MTDQTNTLLDYARTTWALDLELDDDDDNVVAAVVERTEQAVATYEATRVTEPVLLTADERQAVVTELRQLGDHLQCEGFDDEDDVRANALLILAALVERKPTTRPDTDTDRRCTVCCTISVPADEPNAFWYANTHVHELEIDAVDEPDTDD